MKIIGALICRMTKHRRGKHIVFNGDTSEMGRRFQCCRCGAIWMRPTRKPKGEK